MITEVFGKNVANHVEGLTRIKPHGKISAEESLNLLIQQKRYDTALIKLFDRIHNIQTLGAKSPEKAKKIIVETFKKFLVIAIHLECYEIEEKFNEICYKFLYKDKFFQQKQKSLFTSNNLLLFPTFENDLDQAYKL